MRNAGLDEAQVGINIAGRNINNLRYADDTLMAEREDELKNLLINEQNAASQRLSDLAKFNYLVGFLDS